MTLCSNSDIKETFTVSRKCLGGLMEVDINSWEQQRLSTLPEEITS